MENSQTFSPKGGRGRLREWSLTREFYCRVCMGNKTGNSKRGRLREMVAYESGRSKRVDCICICVICNQLFIR